MWYNSLTYFFWAVQEKWISCQDGAYHLQSSTLSPKHHDQPDKHGYKPGLTWQPSQGCAVMRETASAETAAFADNTATSCSPHFLHRLWEKEKLKFSSLIIFHTSHSSGGKLNFPWMPFLYPKILVSHVLCFIFFELYVYFSIDILCTN